MSASWVQHQWGIAAFLVVLCLLALSNFIFLRRMDRYPPAPRLPRLSVLVPARNEADNVERCLRSLLAQEYPDFQVLVLDDHSQDATGEILERLAAEEPDGQPALRVLQGQPLPEGWLGKTWACHQLGEAAEGELLLFADADTRFHSHCALNAVSALLAEGADLLSALPLEETLSWGERLVVPLLPWSVHTFLPVGLAHRLPTPALSVGVGQFMLFRRTAYEKIGGFAAVKADLADDSVLARRVKAHGLRWRLVDGSRRITCRMYRGFREAVGGFGKSLFATFDYRVLPFLFAWTWLGIVFLEPPAVLLGYALGLGPLPLAPAPAAVALALSWLLWGLTLKRFDHSFLLALLHPGMVLVAVGVAYLSLFQTVSGRARWKGRAVAGQRPRLL